MNTHKYSKLGIACRIIMRIICDTEIMFKKITFEYLSMV